jgi:RsmE family RNA methyltransferase
VNAILLEPGEVGPEGRVRIAGRRHRHVREVLRAAPGDSLVVGELDGRMGTGRVCRIDGEALELDVVLDRPPPESLPVALALALPRPPTLRKVLQQVTALGSKRIALFQAARVEKSFWQSRGLEPAAVDEQLRLGLEQARDCVRPQIELVRTFRAFCPDALHALARGGAVWLADAGAPPAPALAPAAIVIGPEGGLLPAELSALEAAGALRIGLGARPLRVETAAIALLALAAERYTRAPPWT